MQARLIALILLATGSLTMSPTHAEQACPALLDYEVQPIGDAQPVRLCDEYAGKVVLVVNTASKCAFTPQYKGLEALHARYADQGLAVIGFPSNDFGAQEPGTDAQIKDFCESTYGVNFPVYSKVRVKGDNAHPFYKALIAAADSKPKWNFHKYLIGRDGQIIDDWTSFTKPQSKKLIAAIETALAR